MIKDFFRKRLWKFIFLCGVPVFSVLLANPADARIVNRVDIQTRATGYEIKIEFFLPLKYISHRPKNKGSILRIQMRPVSGAILDDAETLEELRNREILSWNRKIPIPLREMTYEGGSPDRPNLTLRFLKPVEFVVRSSGDLRTLIILVRAERPKEPEAKVAPPEFEVPIPDLSKGDPRQVELMDEAQGAMIDGNYRRAIQIYTKISQIPDSPFRQDAKELLGLARERNHQLAHAKAEYEEYLKWFPEGPASDRVRQRLAGLITAAAKPKEKLRLARPEEVSEWDTQLFGSLSEFYNYNETELQNGDRIVNRSESITSLDFNARFRSEDYEIRAQFFGSHQHDFTENKNHLDRVNLLTLDLEQRKWGLFGRIGRQTRTTGGVLGRFDGGVVSYEIIPEIKVNAVFGYPVVSINSTEINTDRYFYGANIDLGTIGDDWKFNLFAIEQMSGNLIDRRAVGGEIRYFHPKRSFFTYVDYDIHYEDLNIFLVNGSVSFSTKTRLHVVVDYRKSPFLATTNATIGELGKGLTDLLNEYTEEEIYQLARDRTAISKSATFGITQDLNSKFQMVLEATVSELSGTPTTGVAPSTIVPGTPPTGKEYFYLTQLIGNSLMFDGDITILEFRHADTMNSQTYTGSLNVRLPITPNFRINPRVQVTLRKNKNDDGEQTTLRPLLRVDYRWKRWLLFEAEGGREWRDQTQFGTIDRTKNWFLTIGFRAYY